MYEFLSQVNGEYVVNILTHENAPPLGTNCEQLIPLAYHEDAADGLRLLKVHKQDFLALCKKMQMPPPRKYNYDYANRPHFFSFNPDIVRQMGKLTVDIDETGTPDALK
jgi:hypothetical protein